MAVVDAFSLILKTYTRAFLSQGVGIVGLIWCLAQAQGLFAIVLTVLLLVDQAVFLRGRFAPANRSLPFGPALNVWCLAVSGADLLILFATLFRTAGLRDAIGGGTVTGPLDCLAFSLAAFTRLDIGLSAATGTGRLLAGVDALFGDGVLLAVLAAVVHAVRR